MRYTLLTLLVFFCNTVSAVPKVEIGFNYGVCIPYIANPVSYIPKNSSTGKAGLLNVDFNFANRHKEPKFYFSLATRFGFWNFKMIDHNGYNTWKQMSYFNWGITGALNYSTAISSHIAFKTSAYAGVVADVPTTTGDLIPLPDHLSPILGAEAGIMLNKDIIVGLRYDHSFSTYTYHGSFREQYESNGFGIHNLMFQLKFCIDGRSSASKEINYE